MIIWIICNILNLYTYINIYIYNIHVSIHFVCIYVCLYVCLCLCLCICICTCTCIKIISSIHRPTVDSIVQALFGHGLRSRQVDVGNPGVKGLESMELWRDQCDTSFIDGGRIVLVSAEKAPQHDSLQIQHASVAFTISLYLIASAAAWSEVRHSTWRVVGLLIHRVYGCGALRPRPSWQRSGADLPWGVTTGYNWISEKSSGRSGRRNPQPTVTSNGISYPSWGWCGGLSAQEIGPFLSVAARLCWAGRDATWSGLKMGILVLGRAFSGSFVTGVHTSMVQRCRSWRMLCLTNFHVIKSLFLQDSKRSPETTRAVSSPWAMLWKKCFIDNLAASFMDTSRFRCQSCPDKLRRVDSWQPSLQKSARCAVFRAIRSGPLVLCV